MTPRHGGTRRFWLSWWQPTDDPRPVTVPVPFHWWISGERCDDSASSICALVDASSEAAAKRAVKKQWPEAAEWRFCEEKPTDWLPGDRFPMTEPR